ncbi:hypothetical protein IVB02_39230 [Bradyrhizobium sp. 166]|uniref:hypothetical protein n=1 Tax=Bradyrhizobium sp. 166 TaxID=2782638 RepID=UPI001FF7C432|nr:hypothetical protein [Bradyrhizobium sp. 166]MCK1607249.1 hypothetical protein [Bradyrhizobium sp. 166]
MKAAPPGWQPHQIVTRIDGYIAGRGDSIPRAVAQMIARAMPKPGSSAVAAIRARMLARHKKVLGNV